MLARLLALSAALSAAAPAAAAFIPAAGGSAPAVSAEAAVPIASLYSTGQAAGGSADPHYAIIGVSSPVSGFAYTPGGAATVFANTDGSYPISSGVWALNSDTPAAGYPTNSKWIGPSADANQNWLHSTWVYQTTFTLTGFDPTTAHITGAVAADNDITILLNGAQPHYFFYPGDRGYTTDAFQKQTFELTSGFVAGENSLTFVVRNGNLTDDISAPTGLRVALTGTAVPLPAIADPVPTPEPASAAALGAGVVAGVGYLRRRRVTG